jgi:hypothetical protein
MSQFRIKKINTGLPDEWVFRNNDDGLTYGDDIVAEDPNSLAQAITDTQEVLFKASVYSPAALLNPSSGVLERIKIIEDTVGSSSLQSAYVSGNYINPTPGRNIILGSGGVVEIDSGGNLLLQPTTMKIYSGAQQLDFTKNSITTSTTNLTIGTSGATRDLTVTAGGQLYLKDNNLLAPIKLSQAGSTILTTAAQSLVGAINEIKSTAGSLSLQQAYNQSSPPKILTSLARGKFIVENGTGNSFTPALEVIGSASVSKEIKTESLAIGPGITTNASIASGGALTTVGNITTTGEVRTPTVRTQVGALLLADGFGSAALASSLDSVLTTTKKTIFGALNEIHATATINSATTAAYANQHNTTTGLHEIITTRASSGTNSTDRLVVLNELGTQTAGINGLGRATLTNVILPSYDLNVQLAAGAAHRAGDGTDHSAFASHIAAANPHNTVKSIQAQGSPVLTGAVVLKPGAGVSLIQVGQEIEVSAAAGSTLQGVYNTQASGNWTIQGGKELTLRDDSNNIISAFEQTGSFFNKSLTMRTGASILSDGTLPVTASSALDLSSTNSNITLSTPSGRATIQGVDFAGTGANSIPSHLTQTLLGMVTEDISEKFVTVYNHTTQTIAQGTALTIVPEIHASQSPTPPVGALGIWTPSVNSEATGGDELYLRSAMGLAFNSIAPSTSGLVKLSGKIQANIGTMDILKVGNAFVPGDTIYVSRQGFAEIELIGTPAINNTVTIDSGVANAVYTMANLIGTTVNTYAPTAVTIGHNASAVLNIKYEKILANLVDGINYTPYQTNRNASFRAFLDGTHAYADVNIAGAGTVGETFTIGGVAEVGSTSVILTAVTVANKTLTNQYVISTTASGTAKNLAQAINDTSKLNQGTTYGHFCVAEALGTTVRIRRKEKGTAGNQIPLSTTASVGNITAPPATLSGGRSFARVYMLNRNASGKIVATNNAAAFKVTSFTADEGSSQYIASRFLFKEDRRRAASDKYLKIGKITGISGSGDAIIDIQIEDKDPHED